MNYTKCHWTSSIAIIGLIIIIKFQNCAPPSPVGASASVNFDKVSIIDNMPRDTSVSFLESKIELRSDAVVLLANGHCVENQNEKITWELKGIYTGELIQEGESDCERDEFNIAISKVEEMECGMSFMLKAQVGNNIGDAAVVHKRCVADSVAETEDARFAKLGAECFYESSTQGCFKACYRMGELYYEQEVDDNFCPQN